jgi:hypothetical protein
MAKTFLKLKELTERTQLILDEIKEDRIEDIRKDTEVALFDESTPPDYEELLEAGARLHASERKYVFKGETTTGSTIFIAGDKESDIRNWLQDFIPVEDTEEEDDTYIEASAN